MAFHDLRSFLQRLQGTGSLLRVTDVVMDANDPNVLYAASYQRRRTAFGFNGGGPGSALWKSIDAGATWSKLTGNGLPEGEYGRIGIAVYRRTRAW